MKGAVTLYGQPRYFYNNDTLIRNIIEANTAIGNTIDVFIHTWFERTTEKSIYECAPWAHVQDENQLNMQHYPIEFLLEMYKPKDYIIEPQKDFSTTLQFIPDGTNDYIRRGNVLSQYYSSYKVMDLKRNYEFENKFEYDFVIRARPDTFIEHPLPITEKQEINTLIIPDNCHNPELCNDNFSISSSETYNYISCMYICTQKYLHKGIPYLAEELFKHHLTVGKIHVIKNPEIRQMFFRGINYVHP